MFPWILLGGLVVYLLARSSSSSEVSDGNDAAPPSPSPPPSSGTNLVTSEAGSTTQVTKESLGESGSGSAAFDPFAAALSAYDAYYGAGTGFGVPISGMSDVLGAGTRQASNTEVQAPRSLPTGASIALEGSADAPVESGTRVTFSVQNKDISFGRLEGNYAGPSDPASGSAYVYVDRIAVRPEEAAELLPFGRYTIPASSKSGFSDRLDRVVWEVIDPETVGLKKFASPPSVAVGDKVPFVVRDLYGNVAIAVTTLRAQDAYGGMTVVLDHPWKQQAFKDEGFGSPVFPRELVQATLTAPSSWILDMSKM